MSAIEPSDGFGSMAAIDSVHRNRLGRDVLTFGEIRKASLVDRQNRLAIEGASDRDQLDAAQATIHALEARLSDELAAQLYFDDEARKEKERAEYAEAQLRSSNFYIQELINRLKRSGESIDETPLPSEWSGFEEWCDSNFIGRLSLASAARRGAKGAIFESVYSAAQCIKWLATTYRDGRINGAENDLRDTPVLDGVWNKPCGGDAFEIDWQGRRYTVDWHLKNGGNTRDPRRCLRIYYLWEPDTQQVIVADMPHHRRTGAT